MARTFLARRVAVESQTRLEDLLEQYPPLQDEYQASGRQNSFVFSNQLFAYKSLLCVLIHIRFIHSL